MLVVFATKNGATAEIAEAIADELRRQGLQSDCVRAGDMRGDLSSYAAVVLGSAVYMKRWRREARRFLRRHADQRAALPFWVFSSGPVGEKPDLSWAEPPGVVQKVERLGARAHVVFGGRVPTQPTNVIEKGMARDTPAEFADLRAWEAIRGWAADIARELQPAGAQAAMTTTIA